MLPQALWHNMSMARLWFGCGLAALLLTLAGGALAAPRLERERCTFKPPRGDRIECFVLVVPENRELAEGDWWNETAAIRRRRDVIILSQRGAGGSTPNLDCFDARTSDPAKARRRAVTEQQEQDILVRCRAGFDKRKIDLSMYSTPALADDVADLASAMSLAKINIYGVSYGTRWGLEVMRRYPDLVRAAVLDGVYPPQVNGEQNEPEIVRQAFEQLYADCSADALCRDHHPGLRGSVEG